jgi:hypothetical protein
MALVAQELQTLRDIHLPATPGWWPPAPGWWLLAALAIAAVVWLVMRGWARYQRSLPLRRGRRLYADLYARYQAGELSSREYLDASNELVKRVLIHGLGEHEARRASGERWLELLDRHLDETAFPAGPGRALGDDRFRPDGGGDPEAVHPLVERLLARSSGARR